MKSKEKKWTKKYIQKLSISNFINGIFLIFETNFNILQSDDVAGQIFKKYLISRNKSVSLKFRLKDITQLMAIYYNKKFQYINFNMNLDSKYMLAY